jgi:hypothetical protein
MKTLILFVCLALLLQGGKSQDRPSKPYFTGSLIVADPTASGGTAMNGDMIDPSWKARVAQAGDAWKGNEIIKGSIFYNDEMNKGYIMLEGDKAPREVSLRYNVYSHEINFMKDKKELVLDPGTPVHEFGYSIANEDAPKNIVFRSGYPAIGNNTSQTFYEVVAGKEIALLKYTVKKILEKKDDRGAAEKIIVDAESWYIYDAATKTIAEIKRNKNAVAQALPQYAMRIREITEAKGLRLKSDADWTILLNELAAK